MLSTAALKDIAAGTSAGLVSVVVCHPLDTIRVRLQTAPAGRFTGVADVVRQTIKSEGPLAFYKGMAMPLMAQGAQKATMFFSFGYARRWILEANAAEGKPAGPLPIWQLALCGSFAGLCNTLVANPFELVRNRLQVQYHRDVSQAQYRGPLDAARQISAKAGVRALWLGVGPAMLRDAPGLGAWFVYTHARTMRSLPGRVRPHVRCAHSRTLAAVCARAVVCAGTAPSKALVVCCCLQGLTLQRLPRVSRSPLVLSPV